MLGWPALALTTTGLDRSIGVDPADLRAVVAWAGGVGAGDAGGAGAARFAAVVLDVTRSGVRPRDLDRSARRDVAAVLRRSGLTLAGVDVLIPAEHFALAEHVDRAVGAVVAACGLCAEVAGASGHATRGVVAVALPRPRRAEVLAAIAAAAEREGVRVADYGWPAAEGEASPALGVGLDAAAALAAGSGPAELVLSMGGRLVQARLSDLGAGGRVAAGGAGGRLDVASFGAAVMAAGFAGGAGAREPVVVDVRGVGRQGEAVERVTRAWGEAGRGGAE